METEKLEQGFKGILIFSGIFNIVFASPLILPVLSNHYLYFLSMLNSFFNLGGIPFSSPSHAAHSLLINTAGIDLALIGVIILLCSRNPFTNLHIILANAIGRILFFLIIIFYIINQNLLRIILLFGVIDIIISTGFILYICKAKGLSSRKQ